MPRPISELSNEELIALATNPTAPLEQLADEDVLQLAVQQGYLNQEQAAAALTEKKARERQTVAEQQAPAQPAPAGPGAGDPELEQAGYAAADLTRAALTRGGRVGDVALQVVAPLAGAMLGTAAGGLPGTIAGGGAAGAAADALVQRRQYLRGERDDYSPGQAVAATLSSAVPMPAAVAGRPLAMAGRRAVQGAGIAVVSDAVGQGIDTGGVDLQRLAETGALGALFGGAVGTAEAFVLRGQVLKAIRQTPEFRGFQGSDAELVDAVRTKLNAKPEPKVVSPAGEAPQLPPGGPDPAPPAPPPAAPPPVTPAGSAAMAQFEAAAGMTPSAPPVPAAPLAPIAATPAASIPPEAPAAAIPREIPAGEAPAAVPPITELSDEELLNLARSAGALGPEVEAPKITAPAPSAETVPAPTPEGISGSAPGQVPTGGTADSGGGQAVESVPAATPEGKAEQGSRRKIVDQRRKIRELEIQARKLDEIDPARAAAVRQTIAGEQTRLAGLIATKRSGPTPNAGLAPNGEPDLLTDIADGIGFLSSEPPRGKEINKGDYDDIRSALQSGAARLLRSKQGTPPDKALERLNEMGHKFAGLPQLAEAIRQAAARRDVLARQVVAQEYRAKLEAALFTNTGRKPALKAKAGVLSDSLQVGATLRIRGELFEVKDLNPDTGELTLSSGPTQIKVPAGTQVWPDKGEVTQPSGGDSGLQPFEPPASYAGGLFAGNRYAELSQKLVAGTITPMERLELDAFEAGAGQQYVPGSMDAASIQADRARAAAAKFEAAKQQLQAGADRRLVGGSLETQQDIFGPGIGDTGSLFEPTAQLEFSYDLSGAARGNRPAPNPLQAPGEPAGLPGNRGVAGAAMDPAQYLADPIAHAGPLAAALKEHGRISSIVADYFAGVLPTWSPVGKLIRNAGDVGALMAPLRNPYAESYKIVVLDPMDRVRHAEVLHVGVVSSVNASLAAVLRVVAKTKATRVILSHNHPGGDPTPSRADWDVNAMMRERLRDHGVELVDDVVTNGHAAFSLRAHTLVEIPHAAPSPWEKVPRQKLAAVDKDVAIRIAAELRQSNPEGAFVLYLNIRNRLTAVEQVPARYVDGITPGLQQLIEAGVAREGAAAVILAARSMEPETVKLLQRGLRPTTNLSDVVTEREGSFLANGVIRGESINVSLAASTLQEPATPYGDLEPTAPVIVQAAGAGRGKGSPYAKVNLAHLPNIKIVQMPELVRLVRELTGKLPELRKLRGGTLGHFDSGDVVVRLDPRIFRDPVAAAKTLAHEIGHLGDYLDDGTLKRGNLIGRLQSLRSFLKNTLGSSTVTNADLRDELLAVTQWWKPYDVATSPAWYRAYRESAVELYADALSVLFNSPAELKARAPKFWAEFFNHLGRKPEFQRTLLDLQAFLNKPHWEVLQRRSDDIQKMFLAGDEIFLRKAAEREARYNSFRGWTDRFRQEIFDTFDPLVRRGARLERAGAKISRKINPRLVFDEHPLADNANYRMLQRTWEHVVKPVEAEGFTLHELGEYLFLQRVLNEKFDVTVATIGRAELANPLGLTPETARLGLLRMRLQAGFPRFNRLEAAAAKFHDIVFERIQEAVEVGAYSRKIFKEVLEPNRSTYVTFAVLDHLQDYVPAGLRLQEGTFKEIANPFTSTLLKTVTLNRLIQTQKSKRAAVKFLTDFDPASIAPAPRSFDGKRFNVQGPKDPDRALLELLEDGSPAGFHVDPAIAEMFERMPGARVNAVLEVLNWPFRQLIYPLIIKYNPAFQLVLGPARDLRRTMVNLPGRGSVKYAAEFIRNYGTFLGLPPTEAATAVRAYLRGQPHPLIAEMIARQAIGTPLDNFASQLRRGDTIEEMLRRFGLLPAAEQRGMLQAIGTPLVALLERIEFAGLTFEMLPKVTAYRFLTRDLGWHAQEAAHFARNNVGVPNIHKKGRHVKVIEAVFPFFKVFVNGFRSDLELMTAPKTRGGWWFRWAATDGIWTMLQAAAAAGLLGVGIKELYDGISEYNKTNYNVVPLGTVAGGQYGQRVAYVRFPRDETHRWMSGLLYQGVLAAAGQASKPGASSVIDFGADQVPGLNPVLKIAGAWKDYLEGENPMDGFRGRPVLSNADWLAGGWPAMKGMLGFSLENAGVTNFVRWDPNAGNVAQMTLSAVPGVNRFIGTTDTGYRERQEAMQTAEARQRATVRVAMPQNVQNLLGEYYYLTSLGAELRTLEQTQRLTMLKSWRTRIYQPAEDLAGAEIGFGRRPDPGMLQNLELATQPFERGR